MLTVWWSRSLWQPWNHALILFFNKHVFDPLLGARHFTWITLIHSPNPLVGTVVCTLWIWGDQGSKIWHYLNQVTWLARVGIRAWTPVSVPFSLRVDEGAQPWEGSWEKVGLTKVCALSLLIINPIAFIYLYQNAQATLVYLVFVATLKIA